MKRISLLVLSLLIVMTSITFAADRWYWVLSNDIESVFFDTATIHFEDKDPNHLVLREWIKFTYNQEGAQSLADEKHNNGNYSADWISTAYCLEDVSIFIKDKSVLFHGFYYYDSTGKLISQIVYKNAYQMNCIPGSLGEVIASRSIIYAADNIKTIGPR